MLLDEFDISTPSLYVQCQEQMPEVTSLSRACRQAVCNTCMMTHAPFQYSYRQRCSIVASLCVKFCRALKGEAWKTLQCGPVLAAWKLSVHPKPCAAFPAGFIIIPHSSLIQNQQSNFKQCLSLQLDLHMLLYQSIAL
jgi:hypothetical protein